MTSFILWFFAGVGVVVSLLFLCMLWGDVLRYWMPWELRAEINTLDRRFRAHLTDQASHKKVKQ